tara:strand:+ start:354 stop:560 length:207 start_codon:yes stop_codon:yes gene_type:complete
MANRLKVETNKSLERDMKSRAIINTDSRAFLDYKNKLGYHNKRNEEVRDLKNEIDEIKKILNIILERI